MEKIQNSRHSRYVESIAERIFQNIELSIQDRDLYYKPWPYLAYLGCQHHMSRVIFSVGE